MRLYKTKVSKLAGTDYHELMSNALLIYHKEKSKSKRKPYVRSVYFNNEKVFIDYFWSHLNQKTWPDRARRLKFYACALDLIKNSKINSITSTNPNDKSENYYKFTGIAQTKEIFYVQIKENIKKNKKNFPLSEVRRPRAESFFSN